jgi:hypothetical protein
MVLGVKNRCDLERVYFKVDYVKLDFCEQGIVGFGLELPLLLFNALRIYYA